MNRVMFAALIVFTASMSFHASAEDVVVDFESAEPPGRVPEWIENGVTFKLAHEPKESKAKGLVMFFPHISSGHKGLVCAMATEPIPVQATFPAPAESVTLSLWGSTGCPALLEALDAEGNVIDSVALESVPGRTHPGQPVPIFKMTVEGNAIASIRISGQRAGEYLAIDELRYTPIEAPTAN